MRLTISEALRQMRLLRDVDAGRLKGHRVDHDPAAGHRFRQLPGEWGEQFAAQVADLAQGRVTADTPHYVVTSDELPVAWLTTHAAVTAPDMQMSRNQAKHQRQAAEVLDDLARHSIEELADGRDQREHRPQPSHNELERMVGAVRVTPSVDPTNTTWVQVGGDLDAARRAIEGAVGHHAEEVLIVAGVGYGRHGQYAHRLNLPVLCAINRVSAEHQVPQCVVGDWIDHAAGLAGQPDPATLPELFRVAYAGRYDNRFSYTRRRMREQGWDDLLRDTGMAPFFDEDRYTHHLFTRDVLAIHRPGYLAGAPAGEDVFRRWPSPPTTADGGEGS